MDSGAKRRHIPQWPPFRQPYQHLGSADHLYLSPLPPTAGSQDSSFPGANPFSPDLNAYTAYSPEPPDRTPDPLLQSPGAYNASQKKAKQRRGWRTSVKVALGCAIAVLVANIGLTIGILATGWNMMEGVYMVYKGNCRETEIKDTWVHLALNVVATILLASSNCCMQLLSAPSRSEVDRAHAQRKWLDIGIPSIRNLSSLSKRKVALWWLLGISSIPLHLVYNSVFFSALATNNYSILYASSDFIDGAIYDKAQFPDSKESNVTDIQARAKADFVILNNEECINTYAKDFIEERRNVIVVVRDPPPNQGSLFKIAQNKFPDKITSKYDPFAWICDNPNVLNQTGACCENQWGFVPCSKVAPKLLSIADEWTTGNFAVDHCLSEVVESECHLHFSLILMGVVLFFNVLKVIGIAFVTFRLGEAPLVTVGDGLQSFLRHPDRTTEGMSLASHSSIEASSKLGYSAMRMRYDPRQYRFYEAATWKQWCFLLTVFAFLGVATSLCLALGIQSFTGARYIQNPWDIGLGNVKPQNLVLSWNLAGYGNASIALSALIANAPQVFFSFLYVCYNGIFTVMLLSRELMNFSVTTNRGQKYLRVSDPRGDQKSTYFLNLPYRYAIPLLIGSGLIHWLVSQSVFLANITIIPADGAVPMLDEINTVAFSPLAMLLLLIAGFVLLVFLLVIGQRKLPVGMPMIGSNSMALSAACHPPGGQSQSAREEMVLRPLNWGAVPVDGKAADLGISEVRSRGFKTHDFDDLDYDEDDDGGSGSATFGHCSFSDGPLEPPQVGKFYA